MAVDTYPYSSNFASIESIEQHTFFVYVSRSKFAWSYDFGKNANTRTVYYNDEGTVSWKRFVYEEDHGIGIDLVPQMLDDNTSETAGMIVWRSKVYRDAISKLAVLIYNRGTYNDKKNPLPDVSPIYHKDKSMRDFGLAMKHIQNDDERYNYMLNQLVLENVRRKDHNPVYLPLSIL